MTSPLPSRKPRCRDSYLVFGAPRFDSDTIAEVVAALETGWVGTGPRVGRFQEMLRDYLGSDEAVAVHSCTAALHLSLLAAGIGQGDEVITTAMTFCATANAIVHAGARPVLVDCDRKTQLIDIERISQAITPRTRAIIPVHLAGRPCDMDAITALAGKHNLMVIEDAAHALEAQWRGRKIGTISAVTCFSFYATKNITTGEGGLIATNDAALARRVRMLALHGLSSDAWQRFSDNGYRHYEVLEAGFKYNMMDLQAAIGIGQLAHVDEWLARREEIWRRYDVAFAGTGLGTPPPPEPDTVHARHLYTVMIDRDACGVSRDEALSLLHELGIGAGVHYIGVHLQPFYASRFGYQPEDLPNATWISERTLSVPLSPHMSDEDVDDVIAALLWIAEGAPS